MDFAAKCDPMAWHQCHLFNTDKAMPGGAHRGVVNISFPPTPGDSLVFPSLLGPTVALMWNTS